MTQKTLEKLAKEYYPDESKMMEMMERIAFKRGYTECKEKMYSEEELLAFGKFCIGKVADFLDGKGDQTDGREYSMEELFENFKKK